MSELKGACIIGQSGGPTAVINASAAGVIQTALKSECITRVLGAAYGIKGVLADVLYDMGQEDPEDLELLKYTPASLLGTCRYKLADPDFDDTDYKRILEIFRKYDGQIRHDVLADEIVSGRMSGYVKEWDINGEKVTLGVEKVQ